MEELSIDEMRAEVNEHGVLDIDQAEELFDRLEQAEQDRDKLRNRLDAMRRQRDGYRNQLRKARTNQGESNE